jgi:predicted ABC-class ATPase
MPSSTFLRQRLRQIDQASYTAYKDIQGHYDFPDFTLIFDRIQGDPFAAPSQCRVLIAHAIMGLPPELFHTHSREIALRDYLTRQFAQAADTRRQQRGSGKSGLLEIAPTSQAILERSAVLVNQATIEIRFVVGLPAFGRRIAGLQAAEMLCDDLPALVQSVLYQALDAVALRQHVETAEDADALRAQLADRGLVAFIANGSHLPRRSGVDERPLLTRQPESSIPFQSPASLQVELDAPNGGRIMGMGIPVGVTLIVGGGYHGKSTVLRAVELGVYNHVPGDGRERVMTDPRAVKVRAENGRSVVGVNISPFISHLPQGRSTTQFSTPNASGSTSQAASVIEALEAGAKVLLVDEDTAATNFMIRDRRMQALIAKDQEPITPFVDKIRQLYTDYGVSTILVMGGSGDYFDVADTVIAMQDFVPQDVTVQAQHIARTYPTDRAAEGGAHFGPLVPRGLHLDSGENRIPKRKVRDLDTIVLDQEEIDLAAVEQLVETGQLRAISTILAHLQGCSGTLIVPELLDEILKVLDCKGFDHFTSWPEGDLARFRRFELAAALNRWRRLSLDPAQPL